MIGDFGLVQEIALEKVRTGLEDLRGRGGRRGQVSGLAEMPIRVSARDDGTFEVVDGFKRVRRARAHGEASVTAILERSCSPIERMEMLLRANAPRRTTTVMDEARVVAAMRREGAGPRTIALLLS